MRNMSIRELREALPSIGEILQKEGDVVITRHGRPLARIVSLEPLRGAPSHAELRASMPRMAIAGEELIREDRERG